MSKKKTEHQQDIKEPFVSDDKSIKDVVGSEQFVFFINQNSHRWRSVQRVVTPLSCKLAEAKIELDKTDVKKDKLHLLMCDKSEYDFLIEELMVSRLASVITKDERGGISIALAFVDLLMKLRYAEYILAWQEKQGFGRSYFADKMRVTEYYVDKLKKEPELITSAMYLQFFIMMYCIDNNL